MKIKKKFIAGLLTLALLFTMIPSSRIFAEDEANVNIWFSNERFGGYYPFAKTGQDVYINAAIDAGSDYKVTVQVTKDSSSILFKNLSQTKNVSEKVTLRESGTYSATICVIKNNATILQRNVSIEVMDVIPEISEQPKNLQAKAYQATSFSCIAKSKTAAYQWYVSDALYKEGTEISGASTNTLLLTAENVTNAINGKYYYCIITDNKVSVLSNYALLSVERGASAAITPVSTTKPSPSANSGTTKKIALTVSYDAKQAILKWQGKGHVYRANTKKGSYKYIGTGTGKYKDKKIRVNKRYYYFVSGTNFVTNVKSVKTKPNPVLKKFRVTKKGGKANLVWKLSKTNQAKVSIYIKTGKHFKKLGTVSAAKYPCRLSIPKGYKVWVKIKAYNVIAKKKYYSKYSKAVKLNF